MFGTYSADGSSAEASGFADLMTRVARIKKFNDVVDLGLCERSHDGWGVL